MCVFSRPVKQVTSTKIFGRMIAPGRQVLAYQMRFSADAELAMILPLPVPANSPEDAVRFINLEGYQALFDDLYKPFMPPSPMGSRGMGPAANGAPLHIHAVGAFVASFVPSFRDFARLDPRFQVPSGTLERVPEYRDWGFAVFQLEASRTLAEVHPMAFEFPTRDTRLFFPTLHLHDGAIHDFAEFSHQIYAQGVHPAERFQISHYPAASYVKLDRAEGLIDGAEKLANRFIGGKQPNGDVWLELS